MKYDWLPKPALDVSDLWSLCQPDCFVVVRAADLPSGMLPPSLLDKCESAFVMCSGTANGRYYFMVNLNRTDGREIDQNPYCIAFTSADFDSSGILVQHGSYSSDRTMPLPDDFDTYVRGSGVYPLATLPPHPNGRIGDIEAGSQLEAFRTVVARLERELA